MRLPATALLLASLVLLSGCGYKSNFTDQALEQRFRSNEADFNTLVKMFKEDSELSSVTFIAAFSSYDTRANIPQQRLDEYRGLLKKLSLKNIWRGEKSGNIHLTTWKESDFVMGGANEAYVYTEFPPAEITESLDELRKMTDAFAYKRISDNWYLQVDNW